MSETETQAAKTENRSISKMVCAQECRLEDTGRLHRLDGPAVHSENGADLFAQYGRLHRDPHAGPALFPPHSIEDAQPLYAVNGWTFDDKITAICYYTEWLQRGAPFDGPELNR